MRILCLCDHGNNRSVTVASKIKYLGHDVLSAGVKTNLPGTLDQLYRWADRIILTEDVQHSRIPPSYTNKVLLWHIGPDNYPRPFNRQLLGIVNELIAAHRDELA